LIPLGCVFPSLFWLSVLLGLLLHPSFRSSSIPFTLWCSEPTYTHFLNYYSLNNTQWLPSHSLRGLPPSSSLQALFFHLFPRYLSLVQLLALTMPAIKRTSKASISNAVEIIQEEILPPVLPPHSRSVFSPVKASQTVLTFPLWEGTMGDPAT